MLFHAFGAINFMTKLFINATSMQLIIYLFPINYMPTWKHDIRRNINSDISVATIRRVTIIFFELGVVKNFMQKF